MATHSIPSPSRKRGAALAVGDSIRFLSTWHRIATLEPASEATQRIIPGALRAASADGFSITVDPHQFFEVA